MKTYTLSILLIFTLNSVFARAPVDDENNNDTLNKACLVHGSLYQVVPFSSSCITSNDFYNIIEYNHDNNLYDYTVDNFFLRFYNIAPDPRINPGFYHSNYEVKAIEPHDPDCFENELIY